MCCTISTGGIGAVNSGRTWLSACGPPVEMPITTQVVEDHDEAAAARGKFGAGEPGRRRAKRAARASRSRAIRGALHAGRGGGGGRGSARRPAPWRSAGRAMPRISPSWFRCGLGRKSTAPSSRAWRVTSAPSCVRALTITTGTSCTARSVGSASRPETSGISTSIVTTSGRSRATWTIASRPSCATPMTSISGDAVRRSVSRRRIRAESSTTRTRTRAPPRSPAVAWDLSRFVTCCLAGLAGLARPAPRARTDSS